MTAPVPGALLTAENLRKTYGPTVALDGAGLSLHPRLGIDHLRRP